MLEFRSSLAEFGSGHGPTDRLVRVLRQHIRGEWAATDANVAKLQSLGYPQSLLDTWKALWIEWREKNPDVIQIQGEIDDGLAYRNIIKTAGGYKVVLDIRGREFRRSGFSTAQAAARCADQIRRNHGGALWCLNFPNAAEIQTLKKNRPRWKSPVLRPAVATPAKVKELPPLRTDLPGNRHGVMQKGNGWQAVQGGKYLGYFPTLREAQLAYNDAMIRAPRKALGKRPLLNFIPEEIAA